VTQLSEEIRLAREAAMEVLHHNFPDPEEGLPRTAGWGYPEPYTRDLLLSSPGLLASGDEKLIDSVRLILRTLGKNQSSHGEIPGLVDVPADLGSSDTTPLFLLALEIYRQYAEEPGFLDSYARQAEVWLDYQSPFDNGLITQLPTSDWRDEHWVFGYSLYVNCLVYLYSKLKDGEKTDEIKDFINHRLSLEEHPYYAIYTYKFYTGTRFDLLGNSLAIIAGIPSRARGGEIVRWIEERCANLTAEGRLAVNMPPVLFPFIEPGEDDWRKRYRRFNQPGEYHNGGIWPFTIALYVVALIKLGLIEKAERILTDLAGLVKKSHKPNLDYGFNEWYKAQTGEPEGQDWQTWSAGLFVYAAECLEREEVLFLSR